jgi:hypothetical protein
MTLDQDPHKEKPAMTVLTNTTSKTNTSKDRDLENHQYRSGKDHKMNAIQRTARLEGILHLIMAVVSGFSMLYVPASLIAPGDAATTAQNVLASEGLFRVGMVGAAAVLLLEMVIVTLLYILLKPVSTALSLLAAFSRLAMIVVQGINLLLHFLVLLLLSGAGYLTVFAPDQLQALGLLFLNAHADVVLIWGLFFGLNLMLLGYLVYKSGYISRIPGVLLAVAALCYFIQFFGNILLPEYKEVFTAIGLLSAIEIALPLWLLVKGVNAEQWKRRALEIDALPQG